MTLQKTSKKLLKTTELTKQDLRTLKNLVEECQQADGFRIKLYWNILADRQLPEFDDLFYYQNGKLIGYLALFAFKEEEAELNDIIHPKHRRQGIFSYLLQEAILDLPKRGIRSIQIICNQQAQAALNFVKKLPETQYDHSEYQMIATRNPSFTEVPTIELQLATKDDIPTLARIDNACFNTTFELVIYRFLSNMKELNRTTWFAKVNGTIIGKMHIRMDEGNKAFIHDLCVLPEFRRKHYAAGMVLTIMDRMKKKGASQVYLDVLADNVNAIQLYEHCGFEITSKNDFWKIPIHSLHELFSK